MASPAAYPIASPSSSPSALARSSSVASFNDSVVVNDQPATPAGLDDPQIRNFTNYVNWGDAGDNRMNTRGLYVKNLEGVYAFASVNIPVDGMVSWFKSEMSSRTWVSSVGAFAGTIVSGFTIVRFRAGEKATGAVRYLEGNARSQYTFGDVLAPIFTLCSVTRYAGNARGRILQSTAGDFLHGHWNGEVGLAHYDRWVTPDTGMMTQGSQEWVIVCGTNGAPLVLVNGKNVGTGSSPGGGTRSLTINVGGCCGAERSDWAVMEIMTWNRALSVGEMEAVTTYLRAKMHVGAKATPEHDIEAIVDQGPVDSRTLPSRRGMHAWFKSESAGEVWPSSVGNFFGGVDGGTVFALEADGDGALSAVQYIQGSTSSKYSFPDALPGGIFTMCSVSRYMGGTLGRVLQASTGNFFHGHWASQVGVAHYDGWATSKQGPGPQGSTRWVILCGTNAADVVLFNGMSVGKDDGTGDMVAGDDEEDVTGPKTPSRAVTLNWGGVCGDERSDWGLMELITWKRGLALHEMRVAWKYLKAKLERGTEL